MTISNYFLNRQYLTTCCTVYDSHELHSTPVIPVMLNHVCSPDLPDPYYGLSSILIIWKPFVAADDPTWTAFRCLGLLWIVPFRNNENGYVITITMNSFALKYPLMNSWYWISCLCNCNFWIYSTVLKRIFFINYLVSLKWRWVPFVSDSFQDCFREFFLDIFTSGYISKYIFM